MQLDVWQITGEGFHFGRHGLGQEESDEHLVSDSLFAALVARLAEHRSPQDVKSFVDQFCGESPPFALTSAFPFAGPVRFFPTPVRLPSANRAAAAQADKVKPKAIKKVKYVSEAVFRELIEGRRFVEFLESDQGVALHDGKIVLSRAEYETLPKPVKKAGKIYQIEQRPQVTVGRAAYNSQLYFTGRTVFNDQCGLWFGVQWFDRAPEATLAMLLYDLSVTGVGGERNHGFGAGAINRGGELELPDATNDLWVSLSRYLPRADEMGAFTAQAAYAVEAVGGWVATLTDKNQRRRMVHMLPEGAVLGKVDRAAPGDVVDVQPKYNDTHPLAHEVWRNGRAVAVGVRG
jgi:CRISPR-associated protein Csm4